MEETRDPAQMPGYRTRPRQQQKATNMPACFGQNVAVSRRKLASRFIQYAECGHAVFAAVNRKHFHFQ